MNGWRQSPNPGASQLDRDLRRDPAAALARGKRISDQLEIAATGALTRLAQLDADESEPMAA